MRHGTFSPRHKITKVLVVKGQAETRYFERGPLSSRALDTSARRTQDGRNPERHSALRRGVAGVTIRPDECRLSQIQSTRTCRVSRRPAPRALSNRWTLGCECRRFSCEGQHAKIGERECASSSARPVPIESCGRPCLSSYRAHGHSAPRKHACRMRLVIQGN